MNSEELYSLRWNNHHNHMVHAFNALLQTKTLVDVTLVCAETSIRAHKAVLSACSPFFQRVFADTPCKHPVIVLKDFNGWIVQAIIDFMYRGEIRVSKTHVQTLIQAGESLQIRGLADFGVSESFPILFASTPEDIDMGTDTSAILSPASPESGSSRNTAQLHKLLVSPDSFLDTVDNLQNSDAYATNLPRRKQARPRRRSGEECTPQDLSQKMQDIDPLQSRLSGEKNDSGMHIDNHQGPSSAPQTPPQGAMNSQIHSPERTDAPENLCTRSTTPRSSEERSGEEEQKRDVPGNLNNNGILFSLKDLNSWSQSPFAKCCQMLPNHLPPHGLMIQTADSPPGQHEPSESDEGAPEKMDESPTDDNTAEGRTPTGGTPSAVKYEEQNGTNLLPAAGLPFPRLSSVSSLSFSPPHIFGMEAPPMGLFQHAAESSRLYGSSLPVDQRNLHSNPPKFLKKKLTRPKGQHSAPRGGPPRSWTNAELTEALQHVWNKKMTTSQASRIFGIPYNSLLMYVRGKYGKSLKLEKLRKDCISGPPIELLTMGICGNNNNTSKKANQNASNHSEREPNSGGAKDTGGGSSNSTTGGALLKIPPPPGSSSPLPPDAELAAAAAAAAAASHPNLMFGSFSPAFYPDFSSAFPGLPLTMLNLLPPPPPPPPPTDDPAKSPPPTSQSFNHQHEPKDLLERH
uniref:Putative isoform a marinus n=1 Tax=Lutzomyia longipalpis TaxID=7200 RepID=A0A1B0CTP9_LUTLO